MAGQCPAASRAEDREARQGYKGVDIEAEEAKNEDGDERENNPGANNNVLVTACAVRPSWLFHTWLLFACLQRLLAFGGV